MRFVSFLAQRFAALCISVLYISGAAAAQPLPSPIGEVILTVAGPISAQNRGDLALFDQAMLAEIGTKTIATSTIWTEGVRSFTGTPMAAILQRLGIASGTIQASAINDYTVEIPVADLLEGHALLAWHLDGQPMSVRQKGPVWIVYPYDSNNRFQSEIYFSRSIWQLSRFTLVP